MPRSPEAHPGDVNDPEPTYVLLDFRSAASPPDLMLANPLCCHPG